jgi:hypothetical protein
VIAKAIKKGVEWSESGILYSLNYVQSYEVCFKKIAEAAENMCLKCSKQ